MVGKTNANSNLGGITGVPVRAHEQIDQNGTTPVSVSFTNLTIGKTYMLCLRNSLIKVALPTISLAGCTFEKTYDDVVVNASYVYTTTIYMLKATSTDITVTATNTVSTARYITNCQLYS